MPTKEPTLLVLVPENTITLAERQRMAAEGITVMEVADPKRCVVVRDRHRSADAALAILREVAVSLKGAWTRTELLQQFARRMTAREGA